MSAESHVTYPGVQNHDGRGDVGDVGVGGEGYVVALEVAGEGPIEPRQATPGGRERVVADHVGDVVERGLLQQVGRHHHSHSVASLTLLPSQQGTQTEFSLTK